MTPRERAEQWLAEKMRQQFIGPFEAAETLDDLMLRLGVIAADAIERVWAEAPYELNTREDTWHRQPIPWDAVIEENQAP